MTRTRPKTESSDFTESRLDLVINYYYSYGSNNIFGRVRTLRQKRLDQLEARFKRQLGIR